MPIEIRELVIRATVEDRKEDRNNSAAGARPSSSEYNKIVSELREIRKMLTERNER